MAEEISAAARLRAAFAAFDIDGSGTLTAAELAAALTRKGGGDALSEEDAREIIEFADANGDGVLSIDEFVKLMSGLDAVPTGLVDFSDLAGPNGNVCIPDTAKRAITLDQLTVLVRHTRRRIEGGETWPVKRYVSGAMIDSIVSDPKEVNLYDLDRFVVRPATKPYQCAMVELMAEGEQPPDYFVSHFWGHSIVATLACLEVHSSDRGLERQFGSVDACYFLQNDHPHYLGGRSPRYWICAFANNQVSATSPRVRCLPIVAAFLSFGSRVLLGPSPLPPNSISSPPKSQTTSTRPHSFARCASHEAPSQSSTIRASSLTASGASSNCTRRLWAA